MPNNGGTAEVTHFGLLRDGDKHMHMGKGDAAFPELGTKYDIIFSRALQARCDFLGACSVA